MRQGFLPAPKLPTIDTLPLAILPFRSIGIVSILTHMHSNRRCTCPTSHRLKTRSTKSSATTISLVDFDSQSPGFASSGFAETMVSPIYCQSTRFFSAGVLGTENRTLKPGCATSSQGGQREQAYSFPRLVSGTEGNRRRIGI